MKAEVVGDRWSDGSEIKKAARPSRLCPKEASREPNRRLERHSSALVL